MMRVARSTTSSMGSVHAPVDRYFHPPSHTMVTMTPSSSSAAHFTAPAMIAPDEMPTKRPISVMRRTHSIDSRGRTMMRRSRRSSPSLSSKTSGTKPSLMFFNPSTSSPAGGSMAHTLMSGLR